MNLETQIYPFAYYRGRAISFTQSKVTRPSYFGGPSDCRITGMDHGPSHIHHIATIWSSDLGIERSKFGIQIPLFYGMRFDGCRLKYQRQTSSKIEITEISPNQSSDDWPYPAYPHYLPYLNLEVAETTEMTLDTFLNYVMQEVETSDPEILILIVPPNPTMGVSMWGPSGDAEQVQIVCNCDLQKGTVEVYNACT